VKIELSAVVCTQQCLLLKPVLECLVVVTQNNGAINYIAITNKQLIATSDAPEGNEVGTTSTYGIRGAALFPLEDVGSQCATSGNGKGLLGCICWIWTMVPN
jgi:hypothetical protein